MQALAYVFLLALLVYSLMQRRARQALQCEGEALGSGGQGEDPDANREADAAAIRGHTRLSANENGRRSFPSN